MSDAIPLPSSQPQAAKTRLPWAILALWLATTATAFWFFELRFQRTSASSKMAIFESDANVREAEQWLGQLTAASEGKLGARATVVHVSQGDCPCNRYAAPHLTQIMSTYENRGVSFVRASGKLPRWIETSPSVLVFDSTGHLVYFGPYSDSAWCGARGGFVERTLDELLQGGSPMPQRMITKGCFCGVKAS